jgi:energy-coupling factor transport system permease protein
MDRPLHATAGTLPPELRIISYLFFVASLFLYPNPVFYGTLCIALAVFLARVPFRTLKAGWLPISMFLLFTFVSNAFHHQGRVLYAAGPVLITYEGLHLAAVRASRVLLMIGGVKLLMATTPADNVIGAMSRMLTPFEKIGVPVKDFFHTMGLTMKCFPVLKDAIVKHYRENVQSNGKRNMWDRARLIALFLLPLFVESVRSPELFFKDSDTL